MRVTHTLPPGSPTKRQAIRWGRWREGKVRPKPGNSPHDRPVSRGTLSSLAENLRRFLPRHLAAKLRSIILRSQYAFLKAWRNLSGPMWSKQNQTPGRDRTASRWSAPSPGRRTRREDHALAHRPQMSSGRLFLDRVGRHQSPSPLPRHHQIPTAFRRARDYHRTHRGLVCNSGAR